MNDDLPRLALGAALFSTGDWPSINRLNLEAELGAQPLIWRGVATCLQSSFGIDDVDMLLTVHGLGHPSIFLLNSKKGIKKLPFYTHSDSFTRLYSPVRVLREFFAEGTSLMLYNLHLRHPVIASLRRSLSDRIEAVDAINCFVTPPESQATLPHTDDHSNVVIQLEGCKHWTVWSRIEDVEIQNARSVRELEEVLRRAAASQDPTISEVLSPGDVLLVPQGFLHTARTSGSHSLSLHVQVRSRDIDFQGLRAMSTAFDGSDCPTGLTEVI